MHSTVGSQMQNLRILKSTAPCADAYRRLSPETTATEATRPPQRATRLDSGFLVNLKVLDLSGNQLARVPPCLPPSLEALYLGTNLVCELPKWLPAHLPKLTHLDVHMNNVLFVHGDVLRHPPLRMLAMAQNPVLRGGGELALAMARGDTLPALRMRVQGMTAAQWHLELDSLRKVDADGSGLEAHSGV